MHQRCRNPGCISFKNYGAKGIRVCERWIQFKNFVEDMGEPPSEAHTLDRRNNALGYSKDNCRWATRIEQGKNRSLNRIIEFQGEVMHLTDWARRAGISQPLLSKRLEAGWTMEEALRPARKHTWRNRGKTVKV